MELPLSRLGSSLTCSVCKGYLIDATTITECMHTFCKSCLLQRVESGRTCCPTCGVQLQRSRLSEQLRLDHAIQALVYAAVPGLWQEEQRRRQHFADHHPLSTSVAPPLLAPTWFSPTDPISLSLDFVPPHQTEETDTVNLGPQAHERRFFCCPAAVAVHHFQKLLSLKFELPPQFTVDIYCNGEKLDSSFRLMDVAYKTSWTQEEPLRLQYKISRKATGKSGAAVAMAGNSNSFKHQTSSTTASGGMSSPGQQHPPPKHPWSSRTDLGGNTSASSTKNSSRSGGAITNGTSLKRPRPHATDRAPSSSSSSSPAKQPRLIHHLPPPAPSPPSPGAKARKSKVREEAGDDDDRPSSKPPQAIRRIESIPTEQKQHKKVMMPTTTTSVYVPQLVNAGGSPKKRGRKKRRKSSAAIPTSTDVLSVKKSMRTGDDEDDYPVASSPVKVKELETTKTPDCWTRPSGVELLVQAAALASRENPTPPAAAAAHPPPPTPTPTPPIVMTTGGDGTPTPSSTPLPTLMTMDDAEEDEGKLMIADDPHNNSSASNGRDSGMANEDSSDDSTGALDLSVSSSSRAAAAAADNNNKNDPSAAAMNKDSVPAVVVEPRKSISPLLQQRSSALHSITDSLAQRQQQRLMQQTTKSPKKKMAATPHPDFQHLHRPPRHPHHPALMRDLVTLSQTAALVSTGAPRPPAVPGIHPPMPAMEPTSAATQFMIVAMHQFAAAAAARAASAAPKTPPQSKSSLSYSAANLIRRPF